MATMYRETTYTLGNLIGDIEQGRIALPDIQRPFVWQSAKVRDLFDSMYRGYPIGTLMLWETGAERGTRQIGGGDDRGVARYLVVDGQQRLTSLYAVLTGTEVTGKNYEQRRIRIAFNPLTGHFEVTDAAIEHDPNFIADIAGLWEKRYRATERSFFERLEAAQGEPLTDGEHDKLEERIDRVRDLRDFRFSVIELSEQADEEEVAEIFVRINSKGVSLKQTDFILTMMSVYWEKGRRELEDFARAAKAPNGQGPSPYNRFLDPTPDQLLRVAVGLAFKRGRMQNAYQVLRGKDLETGQWSPERRTAQFERLAEAQEQVLDLTNWHEFLKCLEHAGFRNRRMINSDTTIVYCYVMWLIGRFEFGLEFATLRPVIARWFFMAHTTSRYTGSSETALEKDLVRLARLDTSDRSAYTEELDRIVRATFTTDYWTITLPNALDSQAAKSPALMAYWASLNLLDAEVLFSNVRVKDLIDQSANRGVERHHLFPKAFLTREGISQRGKVNAIANYAFTDWPENSHISDDDPAVYWDQMTTRITPEQRQRQQRHHALPKGWPHLPYEEFLEKRRRLIAQATKEGFQVLLGERVPQQGTTELADLVAMDESHTLEFKSTARWNVRAGQHDKKMEQVVVKTVCGLLNADGGKLVIGVDDGGNPVGLDDDYGTLGRRGDRDGFELWLRQHLDNQLSVQTASFVGVEISNLDGHDVAVVTVGPSPKPVFAKPLDGNEWSDFWVRVGNQTKQLHGSDMVDYRDEHWG